MGNATLEPLLCAALFAGWSGLMLALWETHVSSCNRTRGLVSVSLVLLGSTLAFFRGPWHGLGYLGATAFAAAVCPEVALFWLVSTIFRHWPLASPKSEDILPESGRRRHLRSLIGRMAQATSAMLPSGAIRIDGQQIDAMSEGPAIEKGEWVRVIEVRGLRVVVRGTGQPAETADDSALRSVAAADIPLSHTPDT